MLALVSGHRLEVVSVNFDIIPLVIIMDISLESVFQKLLESLLLVAIVIDLVLVFGLDL